MGCVALGDSINVIPALNYIAKHYPKYKIDLITSHDEIFRYNPNINLLIKDDYDKKKQADLFRRYKYKFSFFPPMNRSVVYHAGCHCIDFMTINAFQIVLPVEAKVIEINTGGDAGPAAEQKLEEAGVDPGRAVLLHPARSWPSRTLPAETWQELVGLIKDAGLQPVVIGKDLPSPINDPVDDKSMIRLKGTIDLTGKFSVLETIEVIRRCKYLVTMDTAPVHLAASSDINIIGIFTIIHPEYRLPYRRDPSTGEVSQMHKTWLVNKKLECLYCADKTFSAMPINTCFLNTYACRPTADAIMKELMAAVAAEKGK
jgi:ADP-heptose:LPS heptosyltransferase